MYNYKEILDWKYNGYNFTISDPLDYSTLIWNDSSEKPSKEFLESKLDLIKNSNILSIRQSRKNEYPSYEEFLDAWVKNDEQALEVYRQKCLAVKAKYPKPE